MASFDDDIPREAYVPVGWRDSDEVTVVNALGPTLVPGLGVLSV